MLLSMKNLPESIENVVIQCHSLQLHCDLISKLDERECLTTAKYQYYYEHTIAAVTSISNSFEIKLLVFSYEY